MQSIKGFWRRSLRVDPSPDNAMSKDANNAADPLTLAIIGCGQRGSVSLVHLLIYSMDDHI